MKTLNESLREIQNSRMSVSDKKKACIGLGLTQSDIYSLEFAGFFRTAKRTTTKKIVLTFGVEIECVVPRSRMTQSATENGLPFAYEGYNHVDNRHHYKFVSDASINDDVRENGCYNGIECVSPILDNNKAGLDSLKNCCKSLNEAGAQVNKSCGLHVHVGVAHLKGEQLVNIYKNYQKLESLIDSFMAPSRRSNCRWARSLGGFDFSNCHDASDLRYEIGTRYCKVNPEAYERHQTVEFRQHQGTTDYEKISMWVSFCTKLVAWSMDNVFADTVRSIDDVPFLNAKERAFFAGRIDRFATIR